MKVGYIRALALEESNDAQIKSSPGSLKLTTSEGDLPPCRPLE